MSEIGKIADGKAILHIPGHPVFVIDRKPWWELPDLARHIRNQRLHPPPPFEGD